MEINWTDADPETGAKRFVKATKFARRWGFVVRFKRFEGWVPAPNVTREMWEELLDALERRVPRREASEADVAEVRAVVAAWQEPPVP
ncbi:MAG TPA: hypothetical protein VGJ05_15060 [Fimbriiglobus sp.]|jgi:hypothetical protein